MPDPPRVGTPEFYRERNQAETLLMLQVLGALPLTRRTRCPRFTAEPAMAALAKRINMTTRFKLSFFALLLIASRRMSAQELPPQRKIEMVRELLKSLETKDPRPAVFLNPNR